MIDADGLLPYAQTERQQEVIKALIETGTYTRAAKQVGVHRKTLTETIKRVERHAARRLHSPQHGLTLGVPEGFTGDFTVQAAKGDVERVWYKGKLDKGNQESAIRNLIEGMSAEIVPFPKIKAPRQAFSEDLASCIVIGDAHFGMLAEGEATLGEDFDLEIASRDLRAAIDYLISTAPPAEEGVLVNVGDFLHIDDYSNATPGGKHQQDTCVRHDQLMRVAGATLRYCIDRMRQYFKRVRVVNAAGNHDPTSAVALSMVLEAAYEKDPRVIVEPVKGKFFFWEFGKNLIGVTHGDKIPGHRLAAVMTQRQAEAWGRTVFRRWWVGHIHHKRYQEVECGCSIESFNTLAPVDAWHAAMGYAAQRGIEMITLHRDYGQVGRQNATIEMVRAFMAEAA